MKHTRGREPGTAHVPPGSFPGLSGLLNFMSHHKGSHSSNGGLWDQNEERRRSGKVHFQAPGQRGQIKPTPSCGATC